QDAGHGACRGIRHRRPGIAAPDRHLHGVAGLPAMARHRAQRRSRVVAAVGGAAQPARTRMSWRDYFELTKPRVVYLIVFTAIVGTLLASPGWPPLGPLVWGNLGIA